ncbi:hypothetical protein MTO96_049720 [Rhipicephalus appendiculatus]
MTSTMRHCDDKRSSRAVVGQPEAAAAPSSSSSLKLSRVCPVRHQLPVGMEASADEVVGMLHAYDAIEEEINDVEHHTISLLLAQVMRHYRTMFHYTSCGLCQMQSYKDSRNFGINSCVKFQGYQLRRWATFFGDFVRTVVLRPRCRSVQPTRRVQRSRQPLAGAQARGACGVRFADCVDADQTLINDGIPG